MTEERGSYSVTGRTELRLETRLPFGDQHYVEPTRAEFQELQRRLGSGSQVAALVGVDPRRIREYVGGQKSIPYAVWRLMLLEAGLALWHGDQQFTESTYGEPDRDEDQVATWWNAHRDGPIWPGTMVSCTWEQLLPEAHQTLRRLYRSAQGGKLVTD